MPQLIFQKDEQNKKYRVCRDYTSIGCILYEKMLFENDKYECYYYDELKQIADFITFLETNK